MRIDYYQYIKKHIKLQDICQKLEIPLYGQGSVDRCKCPFHDDHTPSMSIYKDHAYCHACHKRWDVLDFVGEKLDLDFDERIKWMEQNFHQLLSKKAELINEGEKTIPASGYELAYAVYADMSPEEEQALQQYADERKFEKNFLTERGIFFTKGRKLQSRYVQEEDTYIEEKTKLDQCQLLLRQPWQERALKDRYADYYPQDGIVLTIRDRRQRIVGFVQRAMGEKKPKYKFTKNLPKKITLYRMDAVERKIGAEKTEKPIDLYLVEGVFDALRLEAMGEHAIAVLGSQLTKTQTAELESILREYQRPVSIHIFMDRDEAGQRGNLKTLKNLWSREFFRKCYIDIMVPLAGKDPDECCREGQYGSIKKYLPIKYLFHSYLPNSENEKIGKSTKDCLKQLGIEDRIMCLSRINHWLPQNDWKEIIRLYDAGKERDYFVQQMKAYIGEGKQSRSKVYVERTNYYQFQQALQIACTSYEREALPLDELSWNRIRACADTFFVYFEETLQQGDTLKVPLLTMRFPKKPGEERIKSVYVHERLILQQYVLNEMLGEGENRYESYIPAVRYSRQNNRIYTTAGEGERETVSFAYQIDMDVLLRGGNTDHGMFRDYYGCWKAYIQYVQEGIQKLNSDRIYRLKLDIRKFYDNIPKYAVRRVVFPALLEALRADPDKFMAFQQKGQENDSNALAEKVTSWILGELYEKTYYSSENAVVTEKEDVSIGIPQGPNLSAYIANIVLFEMDRKLLQIVDELNQTAPEGTIRIRYARYVDDMIIISTDAEALLEMKSLISSELYELGLNLSPKTDREDGISKEEALEWTTDQRGGMGVSAVFDFPDETLEDVIEELDSYEVTDRRSALRLLESALFVMDKEMLLEQEEQERLLKILFQTQEIRFTDMVRIAELLLVKAAQKRESAYSENIYAAFMELWRIGKQSSPKDSLFREDGIELFAFIDGCNKVLKRQGDSIREKQRFDTWKRTKKAIGQCWQKEFIEEIEKSIEVKPVLRTNQWILKLRITEILCRLRKEDFINGVQCMSDKQNVFARRWKYALLEKEREVVFEDPCCHLEEEKVKIVELFHYAAFYLGKVSAMSDYKLIKTAILRGANHIFVKAPEEMLGCCLADWFEEQKETDLDQERIRITLLTLLNLLRDHVKAEIIKPLSHYQTHMFQCKKEDIKSCLPVVPGVGYPGIMAETTAAENNRIMKRVDFLASVNVKPQDWIPEEKNVYSRFSMALKDGFFPLDTLFERNTKEELPISLILDIYTILYEQIKDIQKKNPLQSVVLSRKHVFVKRKANSEEFEILLCFYLLPEENSGNGVLLDGGTGRFIFQTLQEAGSYFWEAGYLVKDVCHFDELRLRYENGEIEENQADGIKMMEYTFNRLTGKSINTGNAPKSIHSYKSSVKRAIDRTRGFLAMHEYRDIFLEENAAVDSFISQRMRRDDYHYRPAECSYCLAVWAKGYLRNHFDALMDLVGKYEKRADKKYLTERRVPKAYLVLADYIEKLSHLENRQTETVEEFQGLQALACGFRANAALLQLRMQVLELVESFSIEKKDQLNKQKENLPFAVLGLEEDQELILEDCPITSVLERMLNGENEKRISKITHVGWLVLLEWLLEFERFEKEQMRFFANEIKGWVQSILEDTETDTKKQSDTEESSFPFENMDSFFTLWSCARTEELFKLCGQIDEKTGVQVNVRHSEFYYQKKGRVHIFLDNQHLDKPKYFLTYSKLNNGLIDIEHKDGNSEQKVFSQSVRNGKTIGFSVIEIRLGEMLQKAEYEEDKTIKAEEPSNVEEGEDKIVADVEEQKDESVQCEKNPKIEEVIFNEDREKNTEEKTPDLEKRECRKEEIKSDTDDFLVKIREWQVANWNQRRNNFNNADRIALFQFDTTSSYHHPNIERCTKRKEKDQITGMGYSCEEFRRRKLLREVLQICKLMKVQILLLPEYSVRPETIEFLCQELEKDKENCEFSIWAGTFRIPYDYQFSSVPFEDLAGKTDIFHAAVLPVLMKNDKKVYCYCSRRKKYPSIPMKEDINPCAEMDENLRPIAGQHLPKGRQMYNDARDDVTELICAELFALSSPGNLLSFADASFQLYNNYAAGGRIEFEDYKERMMKDIQAYGSSISLYREKREEKRRPIVLVPACTTRAADYYVLGQVNYLGSGTNMVFCNGSGKLACGGSCFIGQNSWDNEKGRIKKKMEKEMTSIYHGLFPGIYMQTSNMPARGGLGKKEQALLICDIFPDFEKRQPNPESMKHALEIVAHIPILEERIYSKDCIKECKYKEKIFSWEKIQEQQKKSKEESRMLIRQIYEALKKYDEGARTTADDAAPSMIAESLFELGEKYSSEWLKERGKRYLEGHKLFPRKGRPETALDWCYVEMKYEEFLSSDEYTLSIPAKNNVKIEKEQEGEEG